MEDGAGARIGQIYVTPTSDRQVVKVVTAARDRIFLNHASRAKIIVDKRGFFIRIAQEPESIAVYSKAEHRTKAASELRTIPRDRAANHFPFSHASEKEM